MRRPLARTVTTFAMLAIAGCQSTGYRGADAFAPQPGDLLFQDLDCGPLCDAIETVTQGVDGAHFSHVGIVSRTDGREPLVIEAVSAGVRETTLSEFLARSKDAAGNPKVLVGRLDDTHRPLIPEALRVANSFLNAPYDGVYAIDNSSLYCSELVYEAFRQANENRPVFALHPMTFKDPQTGEFFPPWVEYYASLGVSIPEGQPGLNPGSISREPVVQVVHAYGRPEGWQRKAATR
ncbi:MAG: hypothetical protein IT365_10565 [Candidatus Hydrogenedentes bacterium]|nr:hypothetical protein [Candidatus Hydrogenedentota bacterium]